MKSKTFRQWLKAQIGRRDDPVSDLAADLLADSTARRLRAVESIRRHVLTKTADPMVWEALDLAISEWRECAEIPPGGDK